MSSPVVAAPDLETERPAGLRDVLRNRNFLALWSAQLVSQTAQNAIFLILIYVIEEKTQSSFLAGLMVVTFIVPTVILGIGAGVLVDHMDKKTVLIATNAIRLVVTLLFVVFTDAIWALFAINFLFACVSQFFAPAEAAMIPFVVKKRELIAANGLFNITISFAQLLGFIVFGQSFFRFLGPETSFIAIAIAFGLCALICVFVPAEGKRISGLSRDERSSLVTGVIDEIREGFGMLTGDRRIALAILQLALGNSLILVLATIAPGFVSRVVGLSINDAIILLAPAFIGIVGGTLLMPLLARRGHYQAIVIGGLSIMALGLAMLGVIKYVRDIALADASLAAGMGFLIEGGGIQIVIMVFSAVIGLGYAFINVPAQTILMEYTPEAMRGRIFAVQLTFSFMVSVLPLLFAGTIADLFGIEVVLLSLAAVVALMLVATIVQNQRTGRADVPA